MKWLPFLLVLWVLLGLELGLKDALRLGPYPIAPTFVFSLVTILAMSAPPAQVTWLAILVGLTVDLTFPVELKDGGRQIVVIGPYALGFAFGAQLIMLLRSLVFGRNPLTVAFLSAVGSVLANVVVVAIYALRSRYDPIIFNAGEELGSRMGSSLYTGVAAFVLAFGLIPMTSAMGLHGLQQRRFSGGRSN